MSGVSYIGSLAEWGVALSVALISFAIMLKSSGRQVHAHCRGPRSSLRHLRVNALLSILFICGLVHYGATKGTGGEPVATDGRRQPVRRVTPCAVDSDGFRLPSTFSEVTNLCFWGIERSEEAVLLGLAWPRDWVAENGMIDIFGHCQLAPRGWRRLAEVDISGALASAVIEIDLPVLSTNGESGMFFRAASQHDSDGDGVSDKSEKWGKGTNPNCRDTDGDLIEDGEELERGTNPLSTDTDGDGLSDMEELCIFETNPLQADSDGDGLPDGWEVEHGLDPLNAEGLDGAGGDPYFEGISNIEKYRNGNAQMPRTKVSSASEESDYVSSGPSYLVVTGDLEAGTEKSQNESVTIPRGTKAFVGIFLHSDEYPHYTGNASQYNDILSWRITAAGHPTLSGTTQVNDENGDWSAAERNEQCIKSWKPVVFQAGGVYSAPADGDLRISILISAMNVADGALPSTVLVGVFPLENVQANWPVGMGFGRVADSGSIVCKRLEENGVAYISGRPARPTITSKFSGLPEWIDVEWSATLTKERPERPSSDNRSVGVTKLRGNEAFDLYSGVGDSIGGAVAVNFDIASRFRGTTRYRVRGKNPQDSIARSYINAHVPAETVSYAWKIAAHESRQGARIFNQFNTGGARAELPNKGSGFGWGIAQIDNHSGNIDLTPFHQVWDWHENVLAMADKLSYALDRTKTFIGYYREVYGKSPNWSEPPEQTIIGVPVSAEMWSVLTIYNGVGGIPLQSAGTHSGFRSPLQFDPRTGKWIFHANTTNPDYVRRVLGAGMIPNVRE